MSIVQSYQCAASKGIEQKSDITEYQTTSLRRFPSPRSQSRAFDPTIDRFDTVSRCSTTPIELRRLIQRMMSMYQCLYTLCLGFKTHSFPMLSPAGRACCTKSHDHGLLEDHLGSRSVPGQWAMTISPTLGANHVTLLLLFNSLRLAQITPSSDI